MALSYPLSVAAFADLLGVRDVAFDLGVMQEFSGIASGNLQSADLAPARWRADVELKPRPHGGAQQRMALIRWLEEIGGTFYLYDSALYYPQADLDGATLGASTVQIHTVTSARAIRFKGLPVGYVLTVGDLFSISYDSGTRRYLGQIAEGQTADGSGITAAKSILPALPPEVAADDVVTLIKPAAKFKIDPGSAHASNIDQANKTIKFSAIQTYEAD